MKTNNINKNILKKTFLYAGIIPVLYLIAIPHDLIASAFIPDVILQEDSTEAPVFDPVAGTYQEPVNVGLSSATGGATIYYTLDGSDPDDQSAVYSDSITVSETTTIKAIAYADNQAPSEISTAEYVITGPITTLWERALVNGNRPSWFGTDSEQGVAYFDNSVYIASRKDTIAIHRLYADTGADENLYVANMEGIAGGTFPIYDVEVSEDGWLFAANLTDNAAESPFKVYRWNVAGIPEVLVEYSGAEQERFGDQFRVVGSVGDNSYRVYAATTNTSRVFVWDAFGNLEIIELEDAPTGLAASVAPLPNGEFYWNAGGTEARKYASDGTLIGTISGDVLHTDANAIQFIGWEGSDEYIVSLAVGENRDYGKILVVEDGNPENAAAYITTTSLRDADSQGRGDVAVKRDPDGSVKVFVLSTNNGIGGYVIEALQFDFPVFEAPLQLVSIAEARQLVGSTVMIKGVVNSTDFGTSEADFFMQDETGGINMTDFDEGGAQKGQVVEPGDSLLVTGEVDVSNGQINIIIESRQILNRENPIPAPVVISAADWNSDSEYQGMRVQLQGMRIIDEDLENWPADGITSGSGVNIQITDDAAADTFIVRLARNNTPWEAGSEVPPARFHISGTMGQFQDDTQIFPFFEDDFVAAPDWVVSLDRPGSAEINEGDALVVYGRIFADGFTNTQAEPFGQIEALIAYSSEDGEFGNGWIEVEAEFAGQVDGAHEYSAQLTGLPVGVHYYAAIFRDGSSNVMQGGWSADGGGLWDGDNNVNGRVEVVPVTSIDPNLIPIKFSLSQNYPNPFNPTTTIKYALPEASDVILEVYSITGQRVATLVNEPVNAGHHSVQFDGSRLASGVYIYRIQAGDLVKTKKLTLIK